MRYKVGDKIIGRCTRNVRIITSIDLFKKEYCCECWTISDDEIDHEATAKLTLPQPSKDVLRSGMKVILKNGNIRFPLIEVDCFYDECGDFKGNIRTYSNELKCLLLICDSADIMQIWDGDTLIAQRTEKSEAELKKESVEKQMAELSATINTSVKQLDKLKEEIKSL